MKKQTKFLSILLALMLTAALASATLVNAFASDYADTATDDEAQVELTSIEIINAPETYERGYNGGIRGDLCDGLEMLLSFSDGSTYDYSYDEDFDVPACFYENGIAERYDYDNEIISISAVPVGDYETDEFGEYLLPLGEVEVAYSLLGCTATHTLTVVENRFEVNPITKIELTKLPDKAFDTPFIIGDDSEENLSNSIAWNMQGAEFIFYYQNGETMVYECGGEYPKGISEGAATSILWPNVDDPDDITFTNVVVTDLGDYKASFTVCPYYEASIEFSVKDGGTGTVVDPDNKSTDDEVPINGDSDVTGGSSSNGSTAISSTSDTSTNDNAISNNTSNGTVATGSPAVSAVILVFLMLASGVMYVFGRRKELF